MRFFCFILAVAAAAVPAQDAPVRSWNQDVIYFAMTDRFFDGDAANNVPPGSDPALYDAAQRDITKYHGGDLRGLERAIVAGYFQKLGVTALWITPPVRNVWQSLHDLGGAKTGYHGYWAQDFLDVDPHLVSRRSFDGAREYADTRDGRMEHYRDFITLAHKHGLKVIQDIVCNHAGPVFYYDGNSNGQFDRDERTEWLLPYRAEGYPFAKWLNVPEWNALRAMPGGPQTVLGREVKTTGVLQQLDAYGRKGMSPDSLGKRNGEEVACDFFALRDIATAPDGPHFRALVDEFAEIYAFYSALGVDGFRVDTVKHVHREFWDAFTAKLREKIGPERAKQTLIFGEVYDGAAPTCGKYTYRLDWPKNKAPALDSVLNFPVCFAARQYLRRTSEHYGPPRALEDELKEAQREFYNPAPGADGLTARQKMVNFIENHDGLNRFRVAAVGEGANELANALVVLLEGIPCLYYGTETAMQDTAGKIIGDSETGRMTFIRADQPEKLGKAPEHPSFSKLAAVLRLRRELPALHRGEFKSLWADSGESARDDGIFAFSRSVPGPDGKPDPKQSAVVVFNASKSFSTTGLPGNDMRLSGKSGALFGKKGRLVAHTVFPAGAKVDIVPGWKDDRPTAAITMPPRSFGVFVVQE